MSESIRQSEFSASLLAQSLESTTAEVHEVFHEIGTEVANSTVEKTVAIDRTSPPREVVFRSHLVTNAARGLRSAAYLASLRRRRSTKIAVLIDNLGDHIDEPDFAIWTQEPVDELRRLIQGISDAEQYAHPEHEGNSCEILRQVRDTFLNLGWKRYREASVRSEVVRILQKLGTEEEITADHASNAMDAMLSLDLNPSVGLLWNNVETEEDQIFS